MLILDESVAALDVSIQAQVLNLLADIRAQTGVSYILISHDLAVVRQLTDDCVVMQRGRIVERGPSGQVLDHPQDPYTQLLRASVPGPGWKPTRRAKSVPDRRSSRRRPRRLEVARAAAPHAIVAGATTCRWRRSSNRVRTGGLPGRPPDRRRRPGFRLPGARRDAATAKSASRSSLLRLPGMSGTRSASSPARPGSPPASSTRRSSRSMPRARATRSSTSRCGSSRRAALADLLAERGRLPAYGRRLLEPVRGSTLPPAAPCPPAHAEPANILLDHDRALLADFGLAMAASAAEPPVG